MGGLLICGMNWGGKPEDSKRGVEIESGPWAPYFSHPKNYSRGFQAPLATWFDRWGYTLSHESPTLLDRAIAQTNVFLDQSPRFLDKSEPGPWILGVTRLAAVVEEMDFSGVLFVSTEVVEWVIRFSSSNDVPKWNQVAGNLRWDAPSYHRLNLRLGRNGTRHIAGVSHPRCGVARADVQASAKEMRPWISGVLQEYEKKKRTSRCIEPARSAGK